MTAEVVERHLAALERRTEALATLARHLGAVLGTAWALGPLALAAWLRPAELWEWGRLAAWSAVWTLLWVGLIAVFRWRVRRRLRGALRDGEPG